MKFKTSDWRAVGLGFVCLAVAIWAATWTLGRVAEQMLRWDAEHSALEWAEFVASTVDNVDTVFAGRGVTAQGREDLRRVRKVQEIFRFKLFDPAGRLVLTSDDVGEASGHAPETVPPLSAAVRTALLGGMNVIDLHRGRGPDRPAVYCDAYVAIHLDGGGHGFVEVSVDQVDRERRIHGAFAVVTAAVSLLMLAATGLIAWRRLERRATERAAEERLRYLAQHDLLSGTLNRSSFNDALQQAIWRHRDGDPGFSVLCIDLDHFKDINESLGQATGDEILRVVGERLRRLVRHGDFVARLGGDEFAILQSGVVRADDVTTLAQRVVDTLTIPFDAHGRSVLSSGSVGAAIFTADAAQAEELMQKAELALARAKSAGRRTFSFYDAALDERLVNRRHLARDLRDAIAAGQLLLNYQPLYGRDGNSLTGYEALLRWQHPTRGPVSPAEFIPVAEDTGLIDAIGRWVLQSACAEAATWPNRLTVAVNLSAAQFQSGDLLELVSRTLAETGLSAERLELEITESLLMSNVDSVVATLNALASLGIRIAMDDFGTGYSSLAYLWRFPFDKLKIDRAFTMHLGSDERVDLIVKSIITLAHSLDIKVNAEGIETAAQMATLQQFGCDELQGFLLGRPAPTSALAHRRIGAATVDSADAPAMLLSA